MLDIYWLASSEMNLLSKPTIIDIVQMCVWILRVVDHKRTSETIAILRRHMRVIPKCSCLCDEGFSNVKCTCQKRYQPDQKQGSRTRKRFLERWDIASRKPFHHYNLSLYLERYHASAVYTCQGLERNKTVNTSKCTYDSSTPLHASIGQLVFHIDTEVVALHKRPSQRLTS